MNKFLVLLIFFQISFEASAWSCGADINVESHLNEEVYVRFDVQYEKFDIVHDQQLSLEEFFKKDRTQMEIIKANLSQPISLVVICSPGNYPTEVWIGYEVWGKPIAKVVKFQENLRIVIE